MGYFFNTSDINQTFIIEPLSITGGSPTLTACTALYTNAVVSCSGDTQIFMGNGVITFDGNLYTNNDLTANVINASTYYSGGTNLLNIINSENITGGTFSNNTDTLNLYKSNGSIISVTGFTDYYTTGATLIGSTAYFNRNDRLSAYTLNLSTFTADTFVTGVTFSNNQLVIVKNNGTSVSTFINTFTGLTVNGFLKTNTISATTISATTYYGDGSNLTGLLRFSGTTNQLPKFTSPNSIGDSTIKDFGTHVSANNTAIGQWVNTNYAQFGHLNVFSPTIQTNYAILQSSAGETFLNSTGRLHFRQMNNEVAAFNDGNFLIGYIDAASTTYKLDVNGNANFAGSVTATGFTGLPQDIYVTGGTYLNGTTTFINNSGGTFDVSGFTTPFTGGTVTGSTNFTSGLSAATYNGYTPANDSSVVHKTGFETIVGIKSFYDGITFFNSTDPNKRISISPSEITLFKGSDFTSVIRADNISDSYVLQLPDSSGTIALTNSVLGLTGGTVTGPTNFTAGLTANTFSATTYYNLPQDVYVTGSSFNTSSKRLRNTRNDNTNIDVVLPVRTFLTATTTTTNNTLQIIDTITGITDNSNVFIISYLNAYKDSVDYGFWKRTLAVNKVSGLVSVIGENSDFDRNSSGMTANSVIYSPSSGDISISVSGETAKNYTWKSNWEIIK